MEQINVVVSEESERKNKLGLTYHKNDRVNSLEVGSDQAEPGGQTQPKKSGSKKEMKCDRPDRPMVILEAVPIGHCCFERSYGLPECQRKRKSPT